MKFTALAFVAVAALSGTAEARSEIEFVGSPNSCVLEHDGAGGLSTGCRFHSDGVDVVGSINALEARITNVEADNVATTKDLATVKADLATVQSDILTLQGKAAGSKSNPSPQK